MYDFTWTSHLLMLPLILILLVQMWGLNNPISTFFLVRWLKEKEHEMELKQQEQNRKKNRKTI